MWRFWVIHPSDGKILSGKIKNFLRGGGLDLKFPRDIFGFFVP